MLHLLDILYTGFLETPASLPQWSAHNPLLLLDFHTELVQLTINFGVQSQTAS